MTETYQYKTSKKYSLYDLNIVSISLIDAYLYAFAYLDFSRNACGIFLFLL